ncbi:MAG: class I tRNA ligase family protein [Nitrospirales bacterium]|nr:class I tRNA ligase family protein [Nitrospirales bacterium]
MNEKIRIHPEGWKNNYLGWMKQIKDWCISRQICNTKFPPGTFNRNKDHLWKVDIGVGLQPKADLSAITKK